MLSGCIYFRSPAGLIVSYAVLILSSAGLIVRIVTDPAPCKLKLFTQEEVEAILHDLEQVPEYNVILHDVTHGASSGTPLSPEGLIFQNSREEYHDCQSTPVSDFMEELGDAPHPHSSRLLARQMAQLIAYLRKNGGFELRITQELGNCLYASILRGMSIKKEFSTMHLRRLLVVLLGNYPEFFFNLLKYSLATTYGQDRLDESEIARREKSGKIKAGQSADFRLPGPFSFVTYCKHILQNKSWGDAHILTLISMMWQVTITSLNAETLGEIRIRHDRPIDKADIVIIHAGGDHYMGCGKYAGLIICSAGLISCSAGSIPQIRRYAA